MARRLEREFGRFDVDALDSAEYQAMPPVLRNHAYLYLLMLNGWSRKRRTDGLVPNGNAVSLANRMAPVKVPAPDWAERLIQALAAPDVLMLELRENEVFIVKYHKWQSMKAEIEKAQEDARERQARHRLVTPESQPPVTPLSRVTSATTSRAGHATEIERELERDLSLPSPSLVDKSVDRTGVKTPKRLEMPHQSHRGGEITRLFEHLPQTLETV